MYTAVFTVLHSAFGGIAKKDSISHLVYKITVQLNLCKYIISAVPFSIERLYSVQCLDKAKIMQNI